MGIVGIITLPLLLLVYIIFSKTLFGQVLDKKMAEKEEADKKSHLHGNRLRKEFTINVQQILQGLAEETDANRAIIFEFSNGTNNLVGLPFMFMTAAAEVASPGLPLMSPRHQRLNTSIIANFLARLEKDESIYVNRNTVIPEDYMVMEQIMKRADLDSMLFYSIQGMDEAIGFLVVATTKSSGQTLNMTKALLSMSKAAQKISSMINFEEIQKREKKRK